MQVVLPVGSSTSSHRALARFPEGGRNPTLVEPAVLFGRKEQVERAFRLLRWRTGPSIPAPSWGPPIVPSDRPGARTGLNGLMDGAGVDDDRQSLPLCVERVEASRPHTSLLQKVASFAIVRTRGGRRTGWLGENPASVMSHVGRQLPWSSPPRDRRLRAADTTVRGWSAMSARQSPARVSVRARSASIFPGSCVRGVCRRSDACGGPCGWRYRPNRAACLS